MIRSIANQIIVRQEVFANEVVAETLNGLRYPEDYVVQNSIADAEISGMKTFGDIKVENLKGIKTINGIPYEDFVTLNSEQNLPHQITFKNLIIGENLKVRKLSSFVNFNSSFGYRDPGFGCFRSTDV